MRMIRAVARPDAHTRRCASDALRLADVEHLALPIDHPVDAGTFRGELGVALDRRDAGRERALRRLLLERRQTEPLFDLVLGEVDVRVDLGLFASSSGVVRQHGRKIGIRRRKGQRNSSSLSQAIFRKLAPRSNFGEAHGIHI